MACISLTTQWSNNLIDLNVTTAIFSKFINRLKEFAFSKSIIWSRQVIRNVRWQTESGREVSNRNVEGVRK